MLSNVRETMKTARLRNANAFAALTVGILADVTNPYIHAADDKAKHAHGIERAVVACLDTYQEMVKAGYQCYTLNPEDYRTDTFPGLFTSKLNEMAGVKGRS